jgi:putative hydrolase of the HAD superfamily
MNEPSRYKAVLWDFGGVFTTSPFIAFNRYEAERGLPKDFIRRNNSRNVHDNAWAKMERSEISTEEFAELFERETAELGHPVSGADILPLLAGDVQPAMVRALDIVRGTYRTACLTNNMRAGLGPSMARSPEKAAAIAAIMDKFEFVIESSAIGVRKPEPEFYRIACEKLSIVPEQAVYLDDLGINLKPARDLGMTTIKVGEAEAAIDELEQTLGMKLR